MVRGLLLLALVALAAGCAEDPCPRGSMLESDGALLVTEAEHPTGWGQENCADCHAFDGLHRVACTPDVDLDAVAAQVEAEGVASCAACHGDNGVQP